MVLAARSVRTEFVPAKLTENVEIELAVYYGNSSFDDMNWDLELKATNSAK
jgi:hypothetical protein